MSEKLNELRKATMASYLSKAGGRIRSGTKIGNDFEHDAYKDMATVNRHSPYNMDGKEKDPEKLAAAKKHMETNFDLAKTFKRDAANRIKGIARAGRLLAKEEVLDEAPLSPEHKAAIKALKNIPDHYTRRDLDSLAKHTDSIARNAEHESESARYEKNLRVQKKNKNRPSFLSCGEQITRDFDK